jgi:alanine dehydrogenase
MGHKVLIQAGAGQGSGISDELYAQHGAEIVPTAEQVWSRADLIVKVKEPLPVEWQGNYYLGNVSMRFIRSIQIPPAESCTITVNLR